MIRLKKALLFTFGLVSVAFCLLIIVLTIDGLLFENETEEQKIGSWFFLSCLPFITFGGALLACNNRPRRSRKAPLEHVKLVRSLIKSKGGRLPLIRILGSLELAQDEILLALETIKIAKEGEFKKDRYGQNSFVLVSESGPGAWYSMKTIRNSVRRLIVGSSKIRMFTSCIIIFASVILLITDSGDPCCGDEGYYIIIVVLSGVVISCSYIIGSLKKNKMNKLARK